MVNIRQFSFKLIPTFVTLLAFLIMCKLGFWQLDRAKQKEDEIQAFSQLTILTYAEMLEIASRDIEQLHGRQVRLSGAIEPSSSWLIDNKTHLGKVGYSLVAKMNIKTDVNNAPSQSILVDVGWIEGSKYREYLPEVDLPSQLTALATIKAKGFDQLMLSNSNEDAGNEGGQLIRVQSYQQIFQLESEDTLPIIAFAETNTIAKMPQLYKPVVMPPEKHTAYAVQWFLLALASLVVYGFASYKRTKQEST